MEKLLDEARSQDAAYANSIAIPASTTPTLFGTLGVNMSGAVGKNRVEFQATVTLSGFITTVTPVIITIVRGIGGPVVHSVQENMPNSTIPTEFVMSTKGVDYQPPQTGLIIYQAFVSVPPGLAVIPTRVGPESFSAQAYSDV